MKKINTAFIGLGSRGTSNLKLVLNLDNVVVTAVCDKYEDRAEAGADTVAEKGYARPFTTTDYKEVLAREDVEAVVICTDWATHAHIAAAAMRAGKATAMEVGGAYDLEECYDLVNAYEETKMPFMFLENCCYGRNEMLVRNMVNDGKFGEIVHCHGAYGHDLREEVTGGKENRHYRLNEYLNRNCENYPTHELGPIAKILGINRGNRMLRLVSVASKSAGMQTYVNDCKDTIANKELIGKDFKQGDIVNTLITCENGETISLRLDTGLPRSYSREFTVRGTKGMYEENTNSIFLDGDKESFETHEFYRGVFDNAKAYEDEYLPDCWKNITEEMIKAGHGGMDYFEFKDFFDRLCENKPMPIDVYDAAAWMCISCLSEKSIASYGASVEIPDFTNGEYKNRKRFDV